MLQGRIYSLMIFVLIFDASEAFNFAVLKAPFFFSRIRSLTPLRLKKDVSAASRDAIAGRERHRTGLSTPGLPFSKYLPAKTHALPCPADPAGRNEAAGPAGRPHTRTAPRPELLPAAMGRYSPSTAPLAPAAPQRSRGARQSAPPPHLRAGRWAAAPRRGQRREGGRSSPTRRETFECNRDGG